MENYCNSDFLSGEDITDRGCGVTVEGCDQDMMLHEPAYLMGRGKEALTTGDRSEARLWFERVVEIDGENVEAMLWLAGLTDDPYQAIRHLQNALEIEPDNPHALEGLKWAVRRLEEVAGAVVEDIYPMGSPAAVEFTETLSTSHASPSDISMSREAPPRKPRRIPIMLPILLLLLSIIIGLLAIAALLTIGFRAPALGESAAVSMEQSSETRFPGPMTDIGVNQADDLVPLTAERTTWSEGYAGTSLYLAGLLTNQGTTPVRQPEVWAELYDHAGETVATQAGHVPMERLPPGQSVPFEIAFHASPPAWENYRVVGHGLPLDELAAERTRIVQHRAWAQDEEFRVSGVVANHSASPLAEIELILALHDGTGDVFQVAIRRLDQGTLDPGVTRPFEVVIEPIREVAGYTLWTLSRPAR